MKEYERFFNSLTDLRFEIGDPAWNEGATIEELYQAFKARMRDEVEQEVEAKLRDILGIDADEDKP